MAKPTKLKMEYWPIAKIKRYANNSKSHPPEQVSELQASIKEFGFDQPLLVDKDGEIIAGHGRIEAAQAEGLTELPVIQLKHLTQAQVMARRIADNSLPLGGTWLPDVLESELAQLEEMKFPLSPLGLDNIDLPALDEVLTEAPSPRNRSKTTLFVAVANKEAEKARKVIRAALKKANIESSL